MTKEEIVEILKQNNVSAHAASHVAYEFCRAEEHIDQLHSEPAIAALWDQLGIRQIVSSMLTMISGCADYYKTEIEKP